MRFSISRRLFFRSLLLVLVLCALAATFAWRNAETERDQARDRIASSAAAAATTVQQFLVGKIKVLETVATLSAIRNGNLPGIAGEIARIDAPSRGFGEGIVWVDRSGTVIPEAATSIVQSSRSDIATAVRTGSPLVTGARVGSERSPPGIAFVVPTRDDRGQINGTLTGITDLDELRAISLLLQSEGGEVRLVDRSGKLLAPLGASGEVLAVDARSPYERMRRDGAGVLDVAFGLNGSRDTVLGYATEPTSGWLVARSEPQARAFGAATTGFRTELVTLAVTGLLVCLGLLLMSRQEQQAADERSVLLEAERLARSRAELLEQTAEHLAAAQTVADVAKSVVADIQTWGMDIVIVQLIRHGATVEAVAATKISPVLHEQVWRALSERDDVIADVMGTDTMVVFQSGGEHDALYPTWAEERRRHSAETVVVIPLHNATGGVIGALFAASRQPGWLNESRQKVLIGIAEQCGLALERAQLQSSASASAMNAGLLARISDSLSRASTADERSRRLVELLQVERGVATTVYLVADEDRSLKVVGAGGASTVGTLQNEGVVERVSSAIATGEPSIPDPDRDAAVVETDALGSLMVLPLRARGRTLGALAIQATSAGESGRVLDAGLAREIAVRAAFALDNALMYERERDVSHTLQLGLLGGDPRDVDGVEIATAYWPGTAALEVGGDWYDAFALPGGRIALVVGDVVGHSLEAAVAMGQLRGAVRALAPMGTPAQLLERLDAFVETLPASQMTTLAYIDLDTVSGGIQYACAGHPPPLCLAEKGDVRFLWDGRSAPLGVSPEGSRVEATEHLDEGDMLVLYTDGLVERRGESIDVGLERLQNAAQGRPAAAATLVDHLCEALLVDEGHDDDVCIIALRRLHVDERFAYSFTASPSELADLRRQLRSWLERFEVEPEVTQCVVLAVSEAAANAVEHGYGSDGVGEVRVEARLDRRAMLTATVRDRGTWREPTSDSYRGRGITIMQSLMDEVSIASEAGATVVQMSRATAEQVMT